MDINLIVPWTAFAVGVAGTLFSGISARAAKETNVTNAYLDLRERYHDEQMRKAISKLAQFGNEVKWRDKNEWDAKLRANKFREMGLILSEHMPDDREPIMSALRKVSSYFDDVGFLRRQRIISKKVARSFINMPGINVYYEVCVPIHAVRNRKAPSINYAQELRRILPVYDVGLVPFDNKASASLSGR
jgi:hypothetical protein